MLDPKAVDLHVQSQGITLQELRKKVPRHCFKPQEWRSFLSLFRVLALAAMSIWGIYAVGPNPDVWGCIQLAILWPFYAIVLVGLFVLGHDCGHGSFSKKKWINDVLGYALGMSW